jgi:hypothetical protein
VWTHAPPIELWITEDETNMILVCESCRQSFQANRNLRFCSKSCRLVNARSYINRVKPRLAPTARPTTKDIAWAAGFYEAEGCCRRIGAGVTVTQKDPWALNRLRNLFGGSLGKEHGGCRHWYLTGPRAVGFLFTIFMFLSPWRRAQIRNCMTVNVAD